MTNTPVFFCYVLISVFFLGACSSAHRPTTDKVAAGLVKSSRDVTLTWEAPTTNTDGSPLTDLAGYNVYYGPVSDKGEKSYKGEKMEMKHLHLDKVSCKDIEGGKKEKLRTECTYTIKDLSPAHHFFKVTAFNTTGGESDFSNEIQK